MKKYASCLKIREDTQAPSFQAEIFPPRAPEFRKRVWCGRVFHEEAATKKLIEHLTRRSEAWMACDDGGGVCLNGDFLKKTPEKIQDFIHFVR